MTRAPAMAVVLIAVTVAVAHAQTTGDRPVHRIEASVGAGVLGGAELGEANADLRANGTQSQPYRVFTSDLRFASAPVLDVRVGYVLTRRYAIESHLAFGRPELRASVGSDAEGASALTVSEKVDQYVIDAGLVVMLDELRVAGLIPFAAGGGGYLRQLHEGLTLIEEGQVYYLGGGVKRWFFARPRGFVKASGLRIDARLYLLASGIQINEGVRSHGALAGSLFVTF